jgi:hypothetical protein
MLNRTAVIADRQFVTSFCNSDIIECKRIVQIGDRRWLIANRQSVMEIRVVCNLFTARRPWIQKFQA